jgi:divinyl protochlorophyllide a 8-vinyl-reductase
MHTSQTADDIPRIGPNAVTRLAESLRAAGYDARSLFLAAGVAHAHDQPPTQMTPETDVITLYATLGGELGTEGGARIAADAGRRTGNYLLAHRIPRAVQALLRPLPARLAGPILLRAIQRNAWTFAGRGTVTTAAKGRSFAVTFTKAPTCDIPALRAFYAGTFERLFTALVAPQSTVRPVATGQSTWRFDILA